MIYTACVDCGAKNNAHPMSQRCQPCTEDRVRFLARERVRAIKAGTWIPRARRGGTGNNDMARRLVARAIDLGVLLKPSYYLCVDCGSRATQYEHRDYNKPLDVEPVCVTCNNRRGPGIPLQLPIPNDWALWSDKHNGH